MCTMYNVVQLMQWYLHISLLYLSLARFTCSLSANTHALSTISISFLVFFTSQTPSHLSHVCVCVCVCVCVFVCVYSSLFLCWSHHRAGSLHLSLYLSLSS